MEHFKNELANTRNLLLDEISSLGYKEFNQKPGPEQWNVAEICHHLVLAETQFTDAIAYGLKKKELRETEPKRIEDIKDPAKKFKAPDMAKPSSEPFELEKIIQLLSEARERLIAVLNTVEDPSILNKKIVKHPIFGELAVNQWIELLYLHEQRHIEQVKSVKKIVTATASN